MKQRKGVRRQGKAKGRREKDRNGKGKRRGEERYKQKPSSAKSACLS